MSVEEIIGLAEVAQLVGVTKRTAWGYTRRDDFPAPIGRPSSGPVWRRGDVEEWAARMLPLPRGPRPQGDG